MKRPWVEPVVLDVVERRLLPEALGIEPERHVRHRPRGGVAELDHHLTADRLAGGVEAGGDAVLEEGSRLGGLGGGSGQQAGQDGGQGDGERTTSERPGSAWAPPWPPWA